VPVLDATGLVALDSTVAKLHARGIGVVLGGIGPQPLRVLARAGWRNRERSLAIARDFELGLAAAVGWLDVSAAEARP